MYLEGSVTSQDSWGKRGICFEYDRLPPGVEREAEVVQRACSPCRPAGLGPVTISAEGWFLVSKSKSTVSIVG